jgi:Ca2+-binding EF-hand superfamily protein
MLKPQDIPAITQETSTGTPVVAEPNPEIQPPVETKPEPEPVQDNAAASFLMDLINAELNDLRATLASLEKEGADSNEVNEARRLLSGLEGAKAAVTPYLGKGRMPPSVSDNVRVQIRAVANFLIEHADDEETSTHSAHVLEVLEAEHKKQEAKKQTAGPRSIITPHKTHHQEASDPNDIVVVGHRLTPSEQAEYDRTHYPEGDVEHVAGADVEKPKRDQQVVATTGPHRKADAAKVTKARKRLRQATDHGGYVDVQRAAQGTAIAQAGGVDDDATWGAGRGIQQYASAERIVDGKGAYGEDVAMSVSEAGLRNMNASGNKIWISGVTGNGGYLATFNKEAPKALRDALDHNHDGTVTMSEFERAMYNADLSYAKMAALNFDNRDGIIDGALAWRNNRTVSQDEFMKAARYLAQVSGVIQDRGLVTIGAKGNRRFDENGDGKITLDEFRRATEKAGSSIAAQDHNRDSKVSIGEMMTGMLWMEVQGQIRNVKYDAAFDKNHDHKVTVDEVVGVLKSQGITFDQIDNGDLAAVMAKMAPATPAAAKPAPARGSQGAKPQH